MLLAFSKSKIRLLRIWWAFPWKCRLGKSCSIDWQWLYTAYAVLKLTIRITAEVCARRHGHVVLNKSVTIKPEHLRGCVRFRPFNEVHVVARSHQRFEVSWGSESSFHERAIILCTVLFIRFVVPYVRMFYDPLGDYAFCNSDKLEFLQARWRLPLLQLLPFSLLFLHLPWLLLQILHHFTLSPANQTTPANSKIQENLRSLARRSKVSPGLWVRRAFWLSFV